MGRLFLGYLASSREEGLWLKVNDIVAWYAELIESEPVTEKQLD